MEPEQPSEGQTGPPNVPERESPTEAGDAPVQWREVLGALAAQIPPESLPSGSISPEAVRELAADLATELIQQLSQPTAAPAAGGEDVQGFIRPSYECTGIIFACGKSYACNDTKHSCSLLFGCTGFFGCSGGPFSGLRLVG
jgi:hypothetical protein